VKPGRAQRPARQHAGSGPELRAAVQQRPARKGEEGRPARFSHRRPRGLLCALPGVSDSETTRKPGPIVPGPCPAGGDSPRRWLAAEREADVKAPSITPVPRSRAAIRMPVNRARLWRHAGSWSRVRSLRHRGQTRRRAISGWRIRMAVPQPPQAMTTGSMASLVSRVCLKEFVEGVLFSLAACSACAKPVARIAVGHGQLVAGAG